MEEVWGERLLFLGTQQYLALAGSEVVLWPPPLAWISLVFLTGGTEEARDLRWARADPEGNGELMLFSSAMHF